MCVPTAGVADRWKVVIDRILLDTQHIYWYRYECAHLGCTEQLLKYAGALLLRSVPRCLDHVDPRKRSNAAHAWP